MHRLLIATAIAAATAMFASTSLSFATAAPAARPDPDAADVAELAQRNPEAARLLAEARAARDAQEPAKARTLFLQVLEREPEFHTALRGLCASASQLGDHIEAVDACRRAVKAKSTAANLGALALALTHPGQGTRPPAQEIDEAAALAADAIRRDPNLETGWFAQCAAAVQKRDGATLQGCSRRLEAMAADEPASHYYALIAALYDGRWSDAHAAVARARAAGLPESAARELEDLIGQNEPFTHKLLRPALVVAGAWAGALALLLLAGWALSGATLRAASRPASGSTRGNAVGLSRALRRVYAGVLWLACAFYYASMPLLILTVLGVGGGLIYAFFAVGHIPIKLVVVVAVLMLATVWAVLKSLFVRVKDTDPGLPLPLDEHPRLRAALQEVAGKVGTRVVDRVYLTPGTEVAVFERGGVLAQMKGYRQRCLVLGAAALEGLRITPFKAVLAHEYGHLNNEDTAGGGFALAVRRSLLTMARNLAMAGASAWYNPVWLFLNGFYRVFLRISQGASRLQEVLADRWAAFSYGAAAFEAGLRHVVERAIRFDAHANAALKEVIKASRPLANLYRFVPAAPVDEAQIANAVEAALCRQPSPYDSHPAAATRFALVEALPGVPVVDEEPGEAWDLLENRDKLEREMTAIVRENVARAHGVEIEAGEESAKEGAPKAAANR